MKIKEAVELASKGLPEVFPLAEDQELRLEGVEKTDDGSFWKVTFSYSKSRDLIGLQGRIREYKTVKLRDSDGEFMGARDGMLLSAL